MFQPKCDTRLKERLNVRPVEDYKGHGTCLYELKLTASKRRPAA